MVHGIVNEFKEGKWTQKLKAIRDITIPSQYIPKGVGGQLDFETFMSYVMDEPRVADELREAEEAKRGATERQIQAELANLTGNGSGAAGVKLSDTAANRPGLAEAYEKQKQLLADNPPPKVDNPVTVAQALVDSGKSKQEAYATAKERYEKQLGDHFKHIEDANKSVWKY